MLEADYRALSRNLPISRRPSASIESRFDCRAIQGRMLTRMFTSRLWIIAFAIFIASCADRYPSPEQLAANVYLSIGNTEFVLPSVAIGNVFTPDLREYSPISEHVGLKDRERLIGDGHRRDHPIWARTVTLLIVPYETFGELSSSLKACPMLTARWSRELCDHEVVKRSKLPEQIYLIYSRPNGTSNHTASDPFLQAADELESGKATTAIVYGTHYGGVRLSPDIFAVWYVSPHSAYAQDDTDERNAVFRLFTRILSED